MIKPAATAAIVLLGALGACRPDPPARRTQAQAEEAAAIAAPTQPLMFSRKSADGEVSLTLDPRIAAWPALHQRLYEESRRQLVGFLNSAAQDRAAEAAGQVPPYTRESAWRITTVTPRLVGLQQDWSEYTGGAHGARGADALLWSKGGERPVPPAELFVPNADDAALDALLCAAVKGEKAARLGAAAAEATDWACPRWKDSRAVLTPSTVADKAGGLTFLFDPYVLGAYAEGAYEVTIPQRRFRAALVPAWIGEFDGAPKPEPLAERP